MAPSAKRVSHRAAGLSALALSLCAVACQVEANANVKASGSASESSASADESVTTTAPPPAATGAAPAAQPPSSPPEGCPLTCYEAQGGTRVLLSNDEQTQLRTALEPVLGRMRACSSGGEWRHRGSPTIHLRVAPDGTLADLGIDAQHGDAQCLHSAAQGVNPVVSLSGRKAVRCVERCATPRTTSPSRKKRR